MTHDSVIRDFQVRSDESRRSMEILLSFYAILCLHDAFRDITLHISEKALYFSLIFWVSMGSYG